MIHTHLEDVAASEAMINPEFSDIVKNESQIMSVHFGLTSHNIMKPLVEIFETVKEIKILRGKMLNDPINASKYERQSWKLYDKVTDLKDLYYKDKISSLPNVKNAYVTFRSLEGQQRALQAYETKWCRRMCTEYICCMRSVFRKKKLLAQGYYDIGDTVDPDNLIWENIGSTKSSKFIRWFGALSISLMLFAVCFYFYLQTAYLERTKVDLNLSTCGEPFYTTMAAWDDMRSEEPQGYLNCFCKQMYASYGNHGMKILFDDGVQHCQQWYLSYSYEQYSTAILAFFIAIMNLVLHLVFNWMGNLRRPKSLSHGRIYQTYTILMAQYINSVVIFLICFYNFTDDKDWNSGLVFVGTIDEFNERWYLLIGTPLLLAILL